MKSKILDGRYQLDLDQPLGGGAFGTTYRARDTKRPGQPICVVKQLRVGGIEPAFLDKAKRLFEQEAEVMEALGRHDQIPLLLAYFQEEGQFYIVQEFIQGRDLSTELQSGRPWNEDLVIALLRDVLEVLAFVQENRVIHRDIKPENLIRRASDRKIVMIDFGAVKQIPAEFGLDSSVRHTIIGTQGYMPREQQRGRPMPCSDIYALGAIAIQALTGMNAMQLSDDLEEEGRWRRLPSALACDPRLIALLSGMVAVNHRDRYQTAEDVLRDLAPLYAESPSLQPTFARYDPKPSTSDTAPPTQTAEPTATIAAPTETTAAPPSEDEETLMRAPLDYDATLVRSPVAGDETVVRLTPSASPSSNPKVIWFGAAGLVVLGAIGIGAIALVGGDSSSPPEAAIAYSVESVAHELSLDYSSQWSLQEISSTNGKERVEFLMPKRSDSDPYRERLSVMVEGPVERNQSLGEYAQAAIAALEPTFEIVQTEDTTVGDRPARAAIIEGEEDGLQVKKKLIWTIADNHAYAIAYSAEIEDYDRHLEQVNATIDSLQFTKLPALW